MNDDTGFEVTISPWLRAVPNCNCKKSHQNAADKTNVLAVPLTIHPHPRSLTIGGRGKIGVVHTGSVLCVCNDRVAPKSASTKVVLLEVARDLIKAIPVEQVVDLIASEEEFGDAGIDVAPWVDVFSGAILLGSPAEREVKGEVVDGEVGGDSVRGASV